MCTQRADLQKIREGARSLIDRGRLADARALWAGFEQRVRDLASAEPDALEHRIALAEALGAKAEILARSGALEPAFDQLNDCERRGRELAASGVETRRWIAGIQLRRAQLHEQQRYGLSAVCDVSAAVETYRALLGEASDDSRNLRELDLACALTTNARVLARHGDPDVAATSAEAALCIYAVNRSGLMRQRGSELPAYHMVTAAEVAGFIHAARERRVEALIANEAGVRAARLLSMAGTRQDVRLLAAALARQATHLREAGHAEQAGVCFEEALALDAETAHVEQARWCEGQRLADARRTLREMLQTAEVLLGTDERFERIDGLLGDSLRSGVETSALRFSPGVAPSVALHLAEIARTLMPTRFECARRLAVEAHHVFESVVQAGGGARAATFAKQGEQWARLLMALSRACQRHGEMAMAIDAGGWALGVSQRLERFVWTDPGLLNLIADVRSWCDGLPATRLGLVLGSVSMRLSGAPADGRGSDATTSRSAASGSRCMDALCVGDVE